MGRGTPSQRARERGGSGGVCLRRMGHASAGAAGSGRGRRRAGCTGRSSGRRPRSWRSAHHSHPAARRRHGQLRPRARREGHVERPLHHQYGSARSRARQHRGCAEQAARSGRAPVGERRQVVVRRRGGAKSERGSVLTGRPVYDDNRERSKYARIYCLPTGGPRMMRSLRTGDHPVRTQASDGLRGRHPLARIYMDGRSSRGGRVNRPISAVGRSRENTTRRRRDKGFKENRARYSATRTPT